MKKAHIIFCLLTVALTSNIYGGDPFFGEFFQAQFLDGATTGDGVSIKDPTGAQSVQLGTQVITTQTEEGPVEYGQSSGTITTHDGDTQSYTYYYQK